jgi:hypothetical protein
MLVGIDYIGGVNYRKIIAKHHPNGFAAGFLCKASGWKNGIKAARRLAKTGRCPVMRIHGLWHDDHRFYAVDIKRAVRQARKVAKLADRFPDIKFYYSPWLEPKNSALYYPKLYRRLTKVLPSTVEIVIPGYINAIDEVHHMLPDHTPFIFSFDGRDQRTQDVQRWKRQVYQARLFFGWIYECNGLSGSSDETPRALRKHWLTARDIRAMAQDLRRQA